MLAVTGVAFYLVSVLMQDLMGSMLLRNMTNDQMEKLNSLAVTLGEKWNHTSADEFYKQVDEGKPKEQLKTVAENILFEIKNGPPFVYS